MPFRSADEEQVRYAAKAALRERLKRIRRALPRAAASARDARIEAYCLSLITGGPVASYLPMASEISTQGLHRNLLDRGLTVALPTIEPHAERDLTWREYGLDGAMSRHPFGFEMPSADAPTVAPEAVKWVVAPCLAVDQRGFRLGWGGGFYDRAFPALSNANRVAVAYDFQRMAELPNTPGDERVDWVVTDTGVFETTKES